MSIDGERFVLAGRFSDFTHAQLEERLEALGATVASSVSGATNYVVEGSNPGAKIDEALEHGADVIDEEQLLALMEGIPAAEVVGGLGEESAFPQIEQHPRDGTYRTFHDDSEQVELEGELRDGVRHGTWRWYYPSGQLHWEVEHVDGLKEGREAGWHENGEQMYEGQNTGHQKTGTWKWWHANGAYKQTYYYDEDGEKHGEYVWDQADGSPRGRGAFWHGKRQGEWAWFDSSDHEKAIRGYHRGTSHGENAAWYPGGQLAYRRHYILGTKHGEEVEFFEDGSPKLEVTWKRGHLIGDKRTWDEDGNETVEAFVDGLPKSVAEDTNLMERTAEKLARAKDRYAKDNVLKDAVGYGDRGRFLVRMVREGVYDVASDSQLWERYAEAHGLLDGEEVVELLESAEEGGDSSVGHIPGWARSLDELTTRVYDRDPEPIRAAVNDLPAPIERGVAFVMARFGEDVAALVGDPVPEVAHYHFKKGISNRMLWPSEVGVEEITLFDVSMPNANFDRFLELFTTPERWGEELLGFALEEAAENSTARIEFPKNKHAIEAADAEQMPTLLGGISLSGFSIEHTRQALFEWRDDDAQSLAEMALAIDDDGLRKWPAVACAIRKLDETGEPIPDELADALELYNSGNTMSWVSTKIHRFDDDHKKDLAMINKRISFAEPGFGFPKLDLLFDALGVLSEDQRRRLIEGRLDKNWGRSTTASFLHLVEDPELRERAIAAILEDDDGANHRVSLGLANLPLDALPLLEAARQKATEQAVEKSFQRAIIGVLASASDRGEVWDPKWDELVEFDAVQQDYNYSDLRPLLMKVIYNLPRERALRVLRREMGRKSTFGRAFRFIGAHPDQELAEYAFTQLLERESTLNRDDTREIEAGLEYLPDTRQWVKWLLRNGAGSHMKSQFKQAVGHKSFEEIEEELAAEGKEAANELDDVDKLVQRAEKAGGTGETIYILRRLDEAPEEPGLNRIGGLPPGVGAERWPAFDDEPMAHLYTLDLETVPAVAEQYKDGLRTVSVFCQKPGFNEAWEAHNDWTAVVFSTDEQLAKDDLEVPEAAPGRTEAWFESVAVEVDPSIWQADHDNELRSKIYTANARVGGEPIWLQSEAHWGFLLMQFDEGFVHMNLGDCGVMYVFGDTAFWQCH